MKTTSNDVLVKPKKRQPLDALLLSSKLEEYQREQEASRARRKKRPAVRHGSYVPQSAASQFAATAAPHLEPVQSKYRSSPTDTSRGTVMCEVKGAAGAIARGIVAPTIPGRRSSKLDKQEKRDSMSPLAKRSVENQSPAMESPHGPRSMSTSSEANLDRESEADERGRPRQARSRDGKSGKYMPGDATKRLSGTGVFPKTSSVPASFNRPVSYQLHAWQDQQPRRASAIEMKHEPVILEEPETKGRRPKLVPHDRPNWTQQSEAGSALHLPRQVKRPGGDGSARKSFKNEHLIADAVKIIKQEERLKRRQSVIGFFRRL